MLLFVIILPNLSPIVHVSLLVGNFFKYCAILVCSPTKQCSLSYGAIQVLRNAVGVGGCHICLKKQHYEDVQFNIISITMRWVGVEFPEKARYITLAWPLCYFKDNYLPQVPSHTI